MVQTSYPVLIKLNAINAYLFCSLSIFAYCNGDKAPVLGAKIIGGTDANIDDYPSFVALLFKLPERWTVFCGGTYIRALWILTAAHCVMIELSDNRIVIPLSKLLLRMGMSSVDDFRAQDRHAQRIITYPDYMSTEIPTRHDIALIHIYESFELNPHLHLAEVVERFPFADDVTVIGFGSVDANDLSPKPSDRLQKVDLIINNMTPQYLVCASRTVKGACFGDSGGPMYLRQTGTLVGIVSRGNCKSGLGIYVNVYGYRDWIEEVTNGYRSSAFRSTSTEIVSVLFAVSCLRRYYC